MNRKELTTVALIALTIGVVILALMFALPGYNRYQARANANNRVKVSAIEIRNQAQRVQIAKQHAQIRYQNSIGIRESQDEIAKTLTPLYVAFEMTQALEAVATSGNNNSVIYLPTNPASGLPIVPTSNLPSKTTARRRAPSRSSRSASWSGLCSVGGCGSSTTSPAVRPDGPSTCPAGGSVDDVVVHGGVGGTGA